MSDGRDEDDNEIVDFSFDEVVAQLEPEDDLVVEKKSENKSEIEAQSEIEIHSETENRLEVENRFDVEEKDREEKSEGEEKSNPEEVDGNPSDIETESATITDSVEKVVESTSEPILDEETENSEDEIESVSSEENTDSEIQFNPLDPDSVGKFLEDMGVDPAVIESKKTLIDVMQKENELLDKILETQTELHNFVREKNWDSLNEKLESLQSLSDTFAELEEERETLCELIDMRTDEDFSPVLTQVRGKLQRSKIENHALNEYISTTRKFLQGVFDEVVPQRRNTLYSKNGKIVRPELSGVAVNISL